MPAGTHRIICRLLRGQLALLTKESKRKGWDFPGHFSLPTRAAKQLQTDVYSLFGNLGVPRLCLSISPSRRRRLTSPGQDLMTWLGGVMAPDWVPLSCSCGKGVVAVPVAREGEPLGSVGSGCVLGHRRVCEGFGVFLCGVFCGFFCWVFFFFI